VAFLAHAAAERTRKETDNAAPVAKPKP